jgi:hypothetical protein
MDADPLPKGGFSFDLCIRNAMLEKHGIQTKFLKTGTTIVGLIYKVGISGVIIPIRSLSLSFDSFLLVRLG